MLASLRPAHALASPSQVLGSVDVLQSLVPVGQGKLPGVDPVEQVAHGPPMEVAGPGDGVPQGLRAPGHAQVLVATVRIDRNYGISRALLEQVEGGSQHRSRPRHIHGHDSDEGGVHVRNGGRDSRGRPASGWVFATEADRAGGRPLVTGHHDHCLRVEGRQQGVEQGIGAQDEGSLVDAAEATPGASGQDDHGVIQVPIAHAWESVVGHDLSMASLAAESIGPSPEAPSPRMSMESRFERRIRVTESLTLAGDFPAATREQWLSEVGRVLLRGVPDATEADVQRAFVKRLVSTTDDGIEIQPLYTAADAPPPAPAPGQAPFVRSTHAAPVPWEIRQRVWPAVEASSAVTELESGATGVLVTLSASEDDAVGLLGGALAGVLLDLAPVSLDVARPDDQVRCGRALLDRWDDAACPADARRGTLGVDPLGAWARSGGSFDLAALLDESAALVTESKERAPLARALVVDGSVWHEAGATQAQELGWSVASAAWLVRELEARGVPITTAAAAIEFRLAATDDQFVTIAKMRAARRLWARVLEVAGLPESERGMVIHAETSRVMLTRYDTWVNTLRSTVACFAAGVGGADAVTVLPHDDRIQPGGSALGRRVARNTQTILQLESHLARVVDMAGGSWFVESLTDRLAERAWTIVQEVDRDGGMADALESGAIGAAADRARETREALIATRRLPLTGLSEFPDITEPAPGPAAEPAPLAPTDVRFAPLTLHRLAEGFEGQRQRSDSQSRAGERPVVFLATLGTVAQSTARATFAKNLFEAAGIRTVVGSVEAFADAGATVACLCSSDPVYSELGADAAAELRAAGATRIYLAGKGANVAGVDEEFGVGSDVLDVLTRALDWMGVAR